MYIHIFVIFQIQLKEIKMVQDGTRTKEVLLYVILYVMLYVVLYVILYVMLFVIL